MSLSRDNSQLWIVLEKKRVTSPHSKDVCSLAYREIELKLGLFKEKKGLE